MVIIMKKIAIIPARSGSKGLKDKNIIDLNGKPLIAYTIEAALKTGIFERVIVSTDSEKYKQISEKFGAEVIMRGESLSNDTATTYMVIEDLLGRIECEYDYFTLLQPTSPMRNDKHINEACTLFEENFSRVDFLVSVAEAKHASVLVKPIEEDGTLKHFDTDFSNYRRQAFKDYSPNGAIYIAKPQEYLIKKHFYGEKSIAYVMNEFDSLDIDNKLDYDIACYLMKNK